MYLHVYFNLTKEGNARLELLILFGCHGASRSDR